MKKKTGGKIMPNICEYCGCNLDAEREVFGNDKTFTRHSCRGVEQVRKRAMDLFEVPYDKLNELQKQQVMRQAVRDFEEVK